MGVLVETLNVSLAIDELRNRLRQMIGELVGSNLDFVSSDKGKNLLKEMKEIHNKLALASLSQERNLLAVTGLQGAGKTTILRRLYDLEDNYFPENLSRGEQLPILTTETNCTHPSGKVWRGHVDENFRYSIEAESLSASDFKHTAMEPSEEDIWLELEVPNRYFYNPKKSLVLLPGFEQDTNHRSQQLLRHILYLSTSSVVVFRKDIYARQSNETMFHVVKEIFKEVKPIFVLSRGDSNPEQNDEIKKSAIRDFGLKSDETDRVVISGDPTSFGVAWKDELMASISKYGYVTGEGQHQQRLLLENLTNDIRDQLGVLDELIKVEENKAILNGRASQETTSQVIYHFEGVYEKYLETLERKIKEELNTRKQDATMHFNNYIKANHGPWKRFISRIAVNALKEQEQIEAAVHLAWSKASSVRPEESIVEVINEFVNKEDSFLKEPFDGQEAVTKIELRGTQDTFGFADMSDIPDIPDIPGFANSTDSNHSSESFSDLEDTYPITNENKELIVLSKETNHPIDKINEFFDEKNYPVVAPLQHDDLKALSMIGVMLNSQAIIAQPLLYETSELQKLANKGVQMSDQQKKALDKTMDDVQDFSKKVDILKKVTPTLLKSIPVILGTDIVIDGESDIIVHVSKALTGLGLAVSPLGLIGILGGGFAATYAINAIQKGVQETNKYQLSLSQAGRQVIDQLPDLQTEAFIQSLRNTFEEIADRLGEVHRKRKGEYDSDGNLQRIQYASRRIRNMNSALQKQLVLCHAGFTL
jgi:hypothetical protein